MNRSSSPSERLHRTLRCLALPLCVGACSTEPSPADPDTTQPTRCGDYSALKNAYFGDLHTHTSYSLDAYTVATRADPAAAYAFAAKMEPVTIASGSPNGAGPTATIDRKLDFLAVTDHFMSRYGYPIVDTSPYRTDTFTTLIGAELHAPALENGHLWHMLGIGLPFDFAPPDANETGPELAQRAVDAGAFLVLAHPEWYGASVADLRSIPCAHAIEAQNEVAGRLNNRADSWAIYDRVLAAGGRQFAVGGDDAHFRHVMTVKDAEPTDVVASGVGEDAPAGFGCWVWVRSAQLDPDALVTALKAGDFYTSQGPVFHDIRVCGDGSRIEVTNSPVVSAYATSDPASVQMYGKHGLQITHWSASLETCRGSYVRVTVVDAAGRSAWSNPIWID